jgi:hypothetical protein
MRDWSPTQIVSSMQLILHALGTQVRGAGGGGMVHKSPYIRRQQPGIAGAVG